MSEAEFNNRCAEALGWDYNDGHYGLPKEVIASVGNDFGYAPSIMLMDMQFHSSYDWAMLLVREVINRGVFIKFWSNLILKEGQFGSMPAKKAFNSTSQQITEACLEVLEND
jgi:hypothetical protein